MDAEPTPLTCRQCSRGHHDNCTLGEDCGCTVCNADDEAPPATVDTSGIVWEDPPETQHGHRNKIGLSNDQRTALTANPKRWGPHPRLPELEDQRQHRDSKVPEERTGLRVHSPRRRHHVGRLRTLRRVN